MKQRNNYIACVLLLLSLCITIGCLEITAGDTERAVLKSSARIAGYSIAKNNPELAKIAVPYAEGILSIKDSNNFNEVWPVAVVQILAQVKDPIIKASVNDVLSSLSIQIKDIPEEERMKVIKEAVIKPFIEGIALSKST